MDLGLADRVYVLTGASRGLGFATAECLVADGAAGAWQNLDRSGTHVHDVAGGLALLAAAGGVALDPDGDPLLLRPDTERLIRFVAAGTEERARELLRELA